ncbi:MAG TPA: hypothetical protein VME69_16360 [Methylocella sp.]|nr:hypothetical protein [Methylocella sp.]
MILAGPFRLFTATLIAAGSIEAAMAEAPVGTPQSVDGVYAVDIETRQGDCDKNYHWKIAVSGGRIRSIGDSPMAASGQINGLGNVALAFQRFGHVATATGKLARGAGSGTWSSATLQCAGSWHATR